MTFWPLKSAREILPPPLVATVNAGATSPAFNFNSISFAIKFCPQITRRSRIENKIISAKAGPDGCSAHSFGRRGGGTLPGHLFCRRRAGRMRTELFHAVPDIKQTGRAGEQSRAENPDFQQ